MAGGDAKSDLLWVAGVFLLLGLVWLVGGGPARQEATQGPFLEPPAPLGSGEVYGPAIGQQGSTGGNSVQTSNAPKVKISSGNARYEEQGNKEYITLTADRSNQLPVVISGWKLKSSRRNEEVVIPTVSKLFVRKQPRDVDKIILAPGERAVVVTGYPPDDGTIGLGRGLKLNSCSGYLDRLLNNRFAPSLSIGCPSPYKESGVSTLDDTCYNFVRRLSSCHTPKFERRGEIDYVDNASNIDNACRAFIKEHFNYDSCLRWHQGDSDFWGKEWRVYLYHTGELWLDRLETISLYDEFGRLVDKISYGD